MTSASAASAIPARMPVVNASAAISPRRAPSFAVISATCPPATV
ncbi:MAG TPA: hypothetical protein VM785_08615 [Gaiellales bacterium]|nr:hypothetical protein [Gaiellales bacterium]